MINCYRLLILDFRWCWSHFRFQQFKISNRNTQYRRLVGKKLQINIYFSSFHESNVLQQCVQLLKTLFVCGFLFVQSFVQFQESQWRSTKNINFYKYEIFQYCFIEGLGFQDSVCVCGIIIKYLSRVCLLYLVTWYIATEKLLLFIRHNELHWRKFPIQIDRFQT